jgi:hypothetical protein
VEKNRVLSLISVEMLPPTTELSFGPFQNVMYDKGNAIFIESLRLCGYLIDDHRPGRTTAG